MVAPIWTGAGYDAPPTFDASWFSDYKERVGDREAGQIEDRWGLTGAPGMFYDPGTQSVMGGDRTGWMGLSQQNNNYQIRDLADDRSKFTAFVKSGEKAGTPIEYRLVDGKYVPMGVGAAQQWDTNPGFQNRALLAVLGAGALGVAGAAYGLGGAAATGIEGAAGAGAAGGIEGASDGSLWPGAASAGPGYMASLEGAGLLGQGGMAAAGGAVGGAAGSGGTSMSDLASQAGQSVADYATNPKNWNTIAQLGGMLGGGIAGGAGSGSNGPNQAATPTASPALWGGADPSNYMGGGGFRPEQGPTQTQGMFNQYMAPNSGMNVPNKGMLAPQPDIGMVRRPRMGLLGTQPWAY